MEPGTARGTGKYEKILERCLSLEPWKNTDEESLEIFGCFIAFICDSLFAL